MRAICTLLASMAVLSATAATPLSYIPVSYIKTHLPDREVQCLAKNIYFEARNQDEYGKFGVAQVTLNRVDSPRFPDSICKVVFQPSKLPQKRHLCQFSWYCDGIPDRIHNKIQYEESKRIAILAILHRDRDITGGATHYHASYVRPWWAKKLERTVKLGDHIFYRERR